MVTHFKFKYYIFRNEANFEIRRNFLSFMKYIYARTFKLVSLAHQLVLFCVSPIYELYIYIYILVSNLYTNYIISNK